MLLATSLWGMSYAHWLVLLSALISIAGSFTYIRDTIRGVTQPNRVSWGMWALAPLIGTAAAVSAGADLWATSRIFLAGFVPLIVFAVSFINSKSYWKLTVFDLLCGACSAVALAAWLYADSPELAVLLAATGDGLAALPTLRKAWVYPETESGLIFVASLISVLLVLPSIPAWNVLNSAFQIYLLAINAALIVAIYRKRFVWS
jgi:hypothetical protein